ncbi:MAG: glycoside hydrolase family 3 C-terminal domain-containing protein [Clostridia bacterium]|nr:glycoside hydrolase family 3 C-terminal domain-containing protein [Clostridia bacterium]
MKKALFGSRFSKMISVAVCMVVALIMCFAINADTFSASAAKTGWTGVVYTTDYESAQEALDAQREFNKEIAGEGYVLLKNDTYSYTTSGWRPTTVTAPSLPLSAGSSISVFGKNSVNPVYSGSGSSGGSAVDVTIIDALENEGFDVNPTLVDFYKDNNASGPVRSGTSMSNAQATFWYTGETSQDKYTEDVKDSYGDYDDAAVIVFSRIGGEGADLPMSSFADEQGTTDKSTEGTPNREEIDKEVAGNGDWTPLAGAGRESDPFEHYLELDDNEEALIEAVKAEFKNVIIVLNSLSAFEVKPLAEDEGVKSVIWAAGSGMNGFDSLAKIIAGEINPSGRTVDTLAADFTKTPSFANNSGHRVGSGLSVTSDLGNQYTMVNGEGELEVFTGMLSDGTGYTTDHGYFGADYEEGIYVGYQYYETAAAEAAADNYDGFVYEDEVVYPFGYGLSYTTFEWTVGEINVTNDAEYKNHTYTVNVTVKNTGDVAGKDVVELYYEAPYTKGGIEKSKVTLGDFAKTKLLEPGETDTVTLTVKAFEMASFDVYDANDNGKKVWELDAGAYNFYVSKDAHGWATASTEDKTKQTWTLAEAINFDKDPDSGKDVKTHFEEMNAEMEGKVMSRADFAGTFPQSPYWFEVEADNTVLDPFWSAQYRFIYGKNYSAADWTSGTGPTAVKPVPADWSNTPKYLRKTDAELVKDEAWLAKLLMPFDHDNDDWNLDNAVFRTSYDSVEGANKWYYTATGEEEGAKKATYKFRTEAAYTEPGSAPIQLKDLVGKAMDDEIFDDFVAQFTVEQAAQSINGAFSQFKALPTATAFGIISQIHHDGPQGISNSFGAPRKAEMNGGSSIKGNFAPETVVAGTWNKEIAYLQGWHTGQVALWNHSSGWYAPGVNMHRSQFGGRNFEYYSEDATLSGKMASGVVVGAGENGLICYMKHFALNDMETARENNNMSVWADEQTTRQIYTRPFEWAAKAVNKIKTSGDAVTPAAFMTSFNRFGFEWAGACYGLMNGLVRGEWGVIGQFTTDAFQSKNGGMNANQMIRAGGDIGLDLRRQTSNGVTYDFATVFGMTKNNAVYGAECLTDSHKQALYDCVKRQAYCLINTNATMNGYAFDFLYSSDEATKKLGYNISGYDVANKTVTALKGLPFEIDLGDADLADVQYRLYLGTMPEGLTLDPETGVLSGTVDPEFAAGSYALQICVTANGTGTEANFEQDKWVILKNANKAISSFTVVVKETTSYDIIDWVNNNGGVGGGSGGTGSQGPKGDKGDKGDKGETGATGAPGADGREIEIQKSATHIQWRYEGETEWKNLVALEDLKGPAGAPGADGEDGKDGVNGKDACSGNIGGTLAIVFGALAVAGVAFFALKKREN